MSRLPLPNIIHCPALELFRRYKYPDDHAVKQFKEPVIVEVIEKLVAAEDKPYEEVSVSSTTRTEAK